LTDTQQAADDITLSTAPVRTQQAAHLGCEGFAARWHARCRVPRI